MGSVQAGETAVYEAIGGAPFAALGIWAVIQGWRQR